MVAVALRATVFNRASDSLKTVICPTTTKGYG